MTKQRKCFSRQVEEYEMPDHLVAQTVRFLEQNNGHLLKRAKEKEFSGMTENEIVDLEEKYKELFPIN